MRIPRAALAATILAAGLGTFAGTAHADACNNEPSDRDVEITNVVRVGLDDGSAGLTGVVVACVGVLGTPEFTQAGGGLHQNADGSYTIYVCLPDCQPIP
jgi:hypothetical protein